MTEGAHQGRISGSVGPCVEQAIPQLHIREFYCSGRGVGAARLHKEPNADGVLEPRVSSSGDDGLIIGIDLDDRVIHHDGQVERLEGGGLAQWISNGPQPQFSGFATVAI